MHPGSARTRMWIASLAWVILIAHPSLAGVSRAIQEKYRRSYENKALFLKIPIFSDRQYVQLSDAGISPDQGPRLGQARFKVGDQVRVLALEFGGDEIRFKLQAITGTGLAEMIFKFDVNLQEDFPNSGVFDRALQATLTEGLIYSDLEDAKRGYVEDQFERAVREIMVTSGTSREVVLKNMAPRLPAYQDALRDIENLRSRSQDLSAQIAQLQTDNRRLDLEVRTQQSEVARLRSANQAIQEKIDSSTSQLARLGEELRSARGLTQGYQKEIASLQRSLNIKVDTGRDIGSQIGELSQAMRKLQKDNETLENQVGSLRTNLEKLQGEKARTQSELEDAKASNRQMRETIETLTSKEDSLARQYLELKRKKENLDTVLVSIDSFSTRTIQETDSDGFTTGRAQVLLKDIPVGFLEWRLPNRLKLGEQRPGEASFSSESIDYVRVTPDERQLLRSLGDQMKLEVKLASNAPTFEVRAQEGASLREIGERDRTTWRWTVHNAGTQDSRLVLTARLVNKNQDGIPILFREEPIAASSFVRQMRNYLQPIPIGLGVLLGFLLFGIVGIFRRVSHSESARGRAAPAPQKSSYIEQKKL